MKKSIMNIDQKYYNLLYMDGFFQMLKDPSYCYKFYWLEAIAHLISKGVTATTFDEVIDEMIANAWYTVRQFHVHLSGIPADGNIKDALERAITLLSIVSDLPSGASKTEIKNAIREHEADLKSAKEQLTHMVPYRALAGFFQHAGNNMEWKSEKRVSA